VTRAPSQQARRRLAAAVAAQGPEWQKLADTIATGFTNMWVTPALVAIDEALRTGPDDDDD